jgi:hypothetical protein
VREVQKNLVDKHEEKRPLGRSRRRREDNNETIGEVWHVRM